MAAEILMGVGGVVALLMVLLFLLAGVVEEQWALGMALARMKDKLDLQKRIEEVHLEVDALRVSKLRALLPQGM